VQIHLLKPVSEQQTRCFGSIAIAPERFVANENAECRNSVFPFDLIKATIANELSREIEVIALDGHLHSGIRMRDFFKPFFFAKLGQGHMNQKKLIDFWIVEPLAERFDVPLLNCPQKNFLSSPHIFSSYLGFFPIRNKNSASDRAEEVFFEICEKYFTIIFYEFSQKPPGLAENFGCRPRKQKKAGNSFLDSSRYSFGICNIFA
jgi:hypothetical protein